jgi:hypothetical protein
MFQALTSLPENPKPETPNPKPLSSPETSNPKPVSLGINPGANIFRAVSDPNTSRLEARQKLDRSSPNETDIPEIQQHLTFLAFE